VLGPDHRDTVSGAIDLAVNYRDARRLAAAAKIIDEWLPRSQAKLGPAHSTTERAVETAASIQMALGQFDRANKLRAEFLAVLKKELPADDPRLANALFRAGRVADAITVWEKVRDSRTAKLGADHPDTLTAVQGLALAYSAAERAADAIALLEKLYQDRISKLGADHPATVGTLNSLINELVKANPVRPGERAGIRDSHRYPQGPTVRSPAAGQCPGAAWI
jgi:tetratricopeptide (TPR) repeat protein